MGRLLANRVDRISVDTVLRPYRRSDVALGRWDEFEVLVAQPSTGGKES